MHLNFEFIHAKKYFNDSSNIITKSSNEPKNRSNEPKNSYYMLSFFGVYTWTKKRLIKEQKNISNKIVQMKKKQMNKK